MELSKFGDEELESKNCFLLAETQDEFSVYALADSSKKNVDQKDKSEYLRASSVNKESNCLKLPTSSTEVIGEIEDLESLESEHIMFYNTRFESEVENDLLSEISPLNPLDCSSFSDYNEFNFCLNNILGYGGDEVIHEPLSPRAIVSADSVVCSGGGDCSSSTKPLRNIQDSTEDWGQHLIARSQNELHNIFDIVRMSEDMDLHSYQTDPQIQPHSHRIESGVHIVTSGLGKDEIGQERPVT